VCGGPGVVGLGAVSGEPDEDCASSGGEVAGQAWKALEIGEVMITLIALDCDWRVGMNFDSRRMDSPAAPTFTYSQTDWSYLPTDRRYTDLSLRCFDRMDAPISYVSWEFHLHTNSYEICSFGKAGIPQKKRIGIGSA